MNTHRISKPPHTTVDRSARQQVSRLRWAAIGAAVAVTLGGGTIAFVTAAGPGTASVFVPITPCRLLDTRPNPQTVGPRATPIGAAETLTVQVTGANGQCTIPASATAIVMNTTAVAPTAKSFITVYPADVTQPTASNLNVSAGQAPVPNLVTVSLSATGAINIFNQNGTVNIIGDVAGYYQPANGTEPTSGTACTLGGLPGTIVNGFDDEHNVSSKCFTALVSTLAGSGVSGGADGAGLAAQFFQPRGVAVDTLGNVYVVEVSGHRVRKITPTGVVSTLAGAGTAGLAEGAGAAAKFDSPSGVAVTPDGTIYVADTNNNRIRKITTAGVVSTLAGSTAGFTDANGASAQFDHPVGVAVGPDGTVYVADTVNHRIRKIALNGDVSTLAGSNGGSTNGNGPNGRFIAPNGIDVGPDGTVYVADTGNNRIRKVAPNGDVSTLAGTTVGFNDGAGNVAQFNQPRDLALDNAGNVYVADATNHRIRKVTPTGDVSTIVGATTGYVDGVGTSALINGPFGIAISLSGTLYLADTANQRIRRID